MIKRTFKMTFISIAVIALFLAGLNYLGLALDEEPLEYTGLIPLANVASQDNGFSVLESMLWETDRDFNNQLTEFLEEKWHNELVGVFIESHQDKLNTLEATLSKSEFQSDTNNFQAYSASYFHYENLLQLALLQSRHFADQDEYDQAIKLIQSSLEFSHKIKNDQAATLISYLIGINFEHKTLNWLHRLISNYDLSKSNLSSLAMLFDNTPSHPKDSFELIASGEFTHLLSLPIETTSPNLKSRFDLVFNNDFYWVSREVRGNPSLLLELLSIPSHHFFYQQNKTTNEIYKNLVVIQNEKSAQFCNAFNTSWSDANINNDLNKLALNALGKHAIKTWKLTWQKKLNRRCFNNYYIETIKTVIAAKQYTLENKTHLKSLDQLVPDFLDTLPIDAFSGEPLFTPMH